MKDREVWGAADHEDLKVYMYSSPPGGSAGKESAYNVGDLGLIPWRRERLPTPVFWPGEFHGLYSPWGYKELDTTERLSLHTLFKYCIFVIYIEIGTCNASSFDLLS